MSAPRPLHTVAPRAATWPAGTSARAGGSGGTGNSSPDAQAFRALMGQVSRHSGARQVSPWTGEAQAEVERSPAQRSDPVTSRPAWAAATPGTASGASTLSRECATSLAPLLSGPPREGRFQLLLPGGRVLEIHYRSGERQAFVRLRTRHRATAHQLARQAEALAIRLGRECLKDVQVQVDRPEGRDDGEAELDISTRPDPDTGTDRDLPEAR